MHSKLQTVPPNSLSAQAPISLTQSGDNSTQVAHANTVNTITNFLMPCYSTKSSNGSTECSFDTSHYNLFVIGNEDFNSDYFIVPKNRALTESITDEIKAEYATLSDKAILRIKTFPALFTSENHHYGYTDSEHLAHFGQITDIRIQENGIKIYHQRMFPLPQQRLNEIASNLAIKGAASFNELNRTHWTIKNIHLIEELKNEKIGFFGLI